MKVARTRWTTQSTGHNPCGQASRRGGTRGRGVMAWSSAALLVILELRRDLVCPSVLPFFLLSFFLNLSLESQGSASPGTLLGIFLKCEQFRGHWEHHPCIYTHLVNFCQAFQEMALSPETSCWGSCNQFSVTFSLCLLKSKLLKGNSVKNVKQGQG